MKDFSTQFLRTIVTELRPTSTTTEVELLLLFDPDGSLPQETAIQEALRGNLASVTVSRPRPIPVFTLEGVIQAVVFSGLVFDEYSEALESATTALLFLGNGAANVANTIFKGKFPSSFRETIPDFRIPGDNAVLEIELDFDPSVVDPFSERPDVLSILQTELKTFFPQLLDDLPETLNTVRLYSKVLFQVSNIKVKSEPREGPGFEFLTDEIFNSLLGDTNSNDYQNRNQLIKTELDPFFAEDFPFTFISLSTGRFSQDTDSTKSEMKTVFTPTGVLPDRTAVRNTVIRAVCSGKLSLNVTFVNTVDPFISFCPRFTNSTTPNPTTPSKTTTPEPTTPSKVTPKPTTPSKVTPKPTTPSKVTPKPTTPSKVTPKPPVPETQGPITTHGPTSMAAEFTDKPNVCGPCICVCEIVNSTSATTCSKSVGLQRLSKSMVMVLIAARLML